MIEKHFLLKFKEINIPIIPLESLILPSKYGHLSHLFTFRILLVSLLKFEPK